MNSVISRGGHLRSIGTLLCCVVLLFVITGCSKQRAGLAIKKATANIQQAQEWKAESFPDSQGAFKSAQDSLKGAQQSLDGKQYAQALTSAQEAVKQSQEALQKAKTRFADLQKEAARKSMEVARINEGQRENAQLFDDAQKKLTTSEEKYNKQKYEDSINLSTDVINTVEQLLAHLKNQSHNRLTELDRRIKELQEQRADRFLPNASIKAQQSRDEITSKIEEARDYKQAIILADSAITDANQNIIETKKRHSQQELGLLEAKISEAIAEEAPIYQPEALRTAQESFEEILKSFYENQFDTVLAAAELLKPKVEQLITMTRIDATKDKIQTVRDAITNLKMQAVEQYLPGRVKVMEDLVTEAQELFNNNNYDGAKEKANQGLVEQDRIVASFDAMTEKAIQDADGAYKASRKTYERMASIFAGPGATTKLDERVTSRLKTEDANLGSKLDSALIALKLSSENRSQKQFKKAIEQAREVQAVSDSVVNSTFRLVAEHSLISIQDEISGLERQGARQYAPKQLDQVQTLVEDTQKLLNEQHNREAADRAAKTRAYLENVKQELARRGTEEINRGNELVRRINEGGAAATPPPGGKPQAPRNRPEREYPGGASLNNKEAMFEDDLAALRHPEPIIVAQTHAGAPTNASGPTGDEAYHDNRNLTNGTFMHDQAPGTGLSGAPRTGESNGAIIGTRPEPVVPTRERPGVVESQGSYEAPTGPGPFAAKAAATSGGTGPTYGSDTSPNVATGSAATVAAGSSDLAAVRSQVESMLRDEERLRDIRRFQPTAVESARQKLNESSEALAAGNYLKALTSAQEAQRVILEAEQEAAKAAAKENLQKAADRINVGEASGAITDAPAELTEAVNLYEEAENAMKRGDYLSARDASARALVAADDARLYNVNKARDLAALSTRYGGWKNAHPNLAASEQDAAIAKDLLSHPSTAQTGQQVARRAVQEAQLALDHARDFTFQERIDNIYKALNTALRAGANYFNVTEIKKLIAELSVARDEYCTRNFDAVELKLKDIEARLARVIETTPLVLEENLVEVTNKLNALVDAGAENYMAQEVENVKALMNRSTIDFRKHDYYSSYTNIKNAWKLTDEIENRLQEQVYYDAVTELLAQLDVVFHDFENILNYQPSFIKKLVTTPSGQPAAIEFAGRTDPNAFRDKITDIYLRAIHLRPPKSQEGTHEQVLIAIKTAKVASENFQRLYIMDQLSKPDAYTVIDTAFNQIKRAKLLRSEIQIRMIDPSARTKVITAEKIVNF